MNLENLPVQLPPDTHAINCPIEKVVVTEDRAVVHRCQHISWKRGANFIFIPNVTIYLNDSSLKASFKANDAPPIGNSRMLRWYESTKMGNSTSNDHLTVQLDQLCENLHILLDSGALNHHLLDNLKQTLKFLRTSILEGLCTNNKQCLEYQNQLTSLFDRHKKLLSEKKDIYFQVLDLNKQIEQKIANMAYTPPLPQKNAGIIIQFLTENLGESDLFVNYEVPCTQWRPTHEAHLLTAEKNHPQVTFYTKGIVWQNSGEDWNQVELNLSTARPSLGIEMPIPGIDVIKTREKSVETRKNIEVEIRDQIINKSDQDPSQNIVKEPGIPDDQGFTQNYQVAGKVTIPSTGKPYMLDLETLKIDTQTQLVAYPELNDRVYLKSSQKAQSSPILAGPVALYRNGGYMGNGAIDFINPKAVFDLFWGSEDFIHIVRSVDQTNKDNRLTGKSKKHYTINLNINNYETRALQVELNERIHVSETKHIEVVVDHLPEKATLDEDGFIKIEVHLSALEKKQLQIEYHLVLDKNVIM